MRWTDGRNEGLFSYVGCQARIGTEHPLRLVRVVVVEAFEASSVEFERLYTRLGRPSIPLEKLLRALRTSYSARSGLEALPSTSRWSNATTTCRSGASSSWRWTRRNGTRRAFPKIAIACLPCCARPPEHQASRGF